MFIGTFFLIFPTTTTSSCCSSAKRPCFNCAVAVPQDDRGYADDQASWAPETSKSMQMKSTEATKGEAKEECPPCHLC